MAKYKSPSYRNSKVIRINIGTYQLLKELALKQGYTMAEALDRLITASTEREAVVVPRTQMRMPIFSTRVTSVLSVNGTKHSALSIKPKGGVIRG